MRKHEHCDVIKKWADGWIIEFYDTYIQTWKRVSNPTWDDCTEYRAIHPDFPNEYKAWLDGKEIECQRSDRTWFTICAFLHSDGRIWDKNYPFRIKQTRNKELDEALYKAFLICKTIERRATDPRLSSADALLLYSIIRR